jgi:hypothetical protein
MTFGAFFAWLLGNPLVAAAGAALIAFLVGIMKGRVTGAQRERDKQARKDKAAIEDRLEMHREATEQEKRAAGMSDDELDRLITKR